jgi:parvulin-like peptidyl-prolyl isomerase
MQLNPRNRRRNIVRNALKIATAFPLVVTLCVSASAQQMPAQPRPNAQKGAPAPQKGVPATPASASRKVTDDANLAPKVVAVVNGASISLEDLATQCKVRFGEDVIEDLVNKTLIMVACQKQNINITQKDIDEEISRTATKFKLSTAMYLKLIQDERGISPEHYASDVIWPMLALRGLSRGQIKVTPQEMDRAFQSEYGPKVQVRMIACEDPQKLAQLVKEATSNPDSFKTLAKNHSEDKDSASVEGLLPPIRKFGGDEELENVAFSLQPNQISKIFNAGKTNIVLQCVRQLPPSNPPGPQMQEIQARIKVELEDYKLRGMAETVYKSLRESAEVRMINTPELAAQYPGVAAIVNGQSIPSQRYDEALVKRHGVRILEGEINRKLIENALNTARVQITQADIDSEIMRAADYFGFINRDGSPNVEEWKKSVTADDNIPFDVYVRDAIWPSVALKKLLVGKVQVTDDDLRKGFDSNYGPRAEVLAIVLSSQRTAQEVWELARGNQAEQFFGELAHQYSVEPSSKSNFGKVPPLRKNGGQPNLEKAAFDLKPGDISGIIEVSGQFVILKSQGMTTPVVQDFNAVKGELYKDILEKKQRVAMDNYMATMIAEAQVTNYLTNKNKIGSNETKAAMELLEREGSAKSPTRR